MPSCYGAFRRWGWGPCGMTSVWNLCKLLIQKGRIDGLEEKMDVYLAADRLTTEEYGNLVAMLSSAV